MRHSVLHSYVHILSRVWRSVLGRRWTSVLSARSAVYLLEEMPALNGRLSSPHFYALTHPFGSVVHSQSLNGVDHVWKAITSDGFAAINPEWTRPLCLTFSPFFFFLLFSSWEIQKKSTKKAFFSTASKTSLGFGEILASTFNWHTFFHTF